MKHSQLIRRWQGYFFLLISTGLPPVLGVAFIPAIIAATDIDQYGKYAAFQSMLLGLNLVSGLSSAGYIANAYTSQDKKKIIFSNMLWVLLITSPGVLAVAFFIDSFFLQLGWISTVIMAACSIFTYINTLFVSHFVLSKKYGHLLIQSILQLIFQYLCIFFLMKFHSMNAISLSAALLIGTSISAVVCLRLSEDLKFEWKSIKFENIFEIMKYGIPLIIHFFLAIGIGNFDRWYLSSEHDKRIIAQYSVAFTLAGAGLMVLDFFNKIYSPNIFKILKDGSFNLKNHISHQKYFIFNSLISIILIYFLGQFFIDKFINEKYGDVENYFGSMLIANTVYAAYYLAAPYLYFFNKTKYIFLSSGIGGLVVWTSLITIHPSAESPFALIAIKGGGFLVMGVAAIFWALSCIKFNKAR